jgi:predicted RND superfamily exporter protein
MTTRPADDATRAREPAARRSPFTAEAVVAWLLRRGRWVWAVTLLLAAPATIRTVALYAGLRSDLEQLLPRDAPSVAAIDELRARLAGLQHLGVVVDTGTPEQLAAGERFLDDLAARIRAYPPPLAATVRVGDAAERRFLRDHALLYADRADLEALQSRIEARRDYEVAKQTGGLLDEDEPAPPLDFGDLRAKYDKPPSEHRPGDRFSSPDLHLTLLLVDVGEFSTGRGRGEKLLDRVRADVRALDPARYAPGMRVGYTGDVAISVEETSALLTDLSISSVLVVALVLAALVAYFRWWRCVLVLLPPLFLATALAFALASLPPFGVTALNSNTAFLGSIIVGNGINFGIVLLARYVEERRAGRGVEPSLAAALRGARGGTLAAALAAGAAYASLALTEFRGFRQFGVVGGLGMVLAWLAAFLLMPPLIAWVDDGGARGPAPIARASRFTAPLAAFVTRRPGPVLAACAVVTALALFAARGFGPDRIESDFSRLRRADTWQTGEGYWGRKMEAVLGTYLTPTVVLTDEADDARAEAAALKVATLAPPLAGRVASVRTLDDVVPRDQDAKRAVGRAIRDDLTPSIRAKLTEEDRDALDRLLAGVDAPTLGPDDVPPGLTVGLRERDGALGRAVLVFPRPSRALWQADVLASFVGALRAVARDASPHPARVAGSLPLSADIVAGVARDGPRASLAAFVAVALIALALYGAGRVSAIVVGSLAVAVVSLAGAMMATGVRLNFANFIAFPITFGIGVDYAVNVASRYVQDGARDVASAVRTTGGAVALCSLTTVLGYSSLLLAENRALFSFGVVAVLGEIAALSTALVALPAFLAWRDRRAARA